eukprot:TRINITY_DN973_c0_g1_i2.p1 TRINITY_DN973_c0_g1~~TRINITY_DN973_c0_g1_i2.p1  ORF type:complete len:448 (+),score=13.09 TRINITY_DN973_c0_g1_i2:135-1478(+)
MEISIAGEDNLKLKLTESDGCHHDMTVKELRQLVYERLPDLPSAFRLLWLAYTLLDHRRVFIDYKINAPLWLFNPDSKSIKQEPWHDSESPDRTSMTIYVMDFGTRSTVRLKMKKRGQIRALKCDYCSVLDIDPASVRLFLQSERIDDHDVAYSLELKNGDIIISAWAKHTHELPDPFVLPSGHIFKNRLFKPVMSECMADPVICAPTKELLRLYENWAGLGAAVLITGSIMVDRRYLEAPGNVVVEDERDMDMLERWAAVSQTCGSELWAQISHPGRQCPRSVSWEPVAPSDLPPVLTGIHPYYAAARALTKPEITDIVERFATTVRILKKAGFSGVQIHAAHGHLISQFLSPTTNHRTDEYGGPIENRWRLLRDVVRAVRDAVGMKFIVCVKLNGVGDSRLNARQSSSHCRALRTVSWVEPTHSRRIVLFSEVAVFWCFLHRNMH